MVRILAGLGVVATVLTAGVQPSSADPRPYCLQGRGAPGGGLPDCSYHTWEQCRASVGGGSDSCFENPELLWRARGQGQVRTQPAPRRQSRERY